MKVVKNLIYSLIDKLTFGTGIARTINGLTIYFPAKWSRYFESDYEKENVDFLKQQCKPNMTIIDVGAHLGLISVICSKLINKSGKIYSFEPTPATFKVLNTIVQLNKAEEIIQPINKAVSSEIGTLDFYLASDEGSNSNSLVSKNHRNRVPIKINVTSIDSFAAENNIKKIDLIKIDAEGTEYSVLLGAKKSIQTHKPKIILALHPPLIKNNNQKIDEIFDLIYDFGYSVLYKQKQLNKTEFCAIEDFFDVHLIPQN